MANDTSLKGSDGRAESNGIKADGQVGTLAYYAPWGDVVLFFGSFGSATGLYELGHAISGGEYIKGMSGTIKIEKGGSQ